ncbi:hypothetical protein CRE_04184 [Caenorhabditis remanei]|uniref:F-box associated domain-containing protein n=1 Tax=Caenorhabditis remanei TaxID=31234 RepID=E3MYV4_CAERE|nr:hypothetical protein CRE_04184 [Caenorhabditis remanei]
MSLSKPFPLLRLPRLPLFKVFNDIGVQEQFYLSICSSKAKYAIKFYNSRQKFSVTFRFTNNFEFSLKAENSYDKFQIDIQTVTPIFGPMWTFLSSFDVEAPTNVQRLLLFVMDVYNTPTISLVFEERPHDYVSGFINFIQSLKLKIHYLGIRSHNEEDVKFVLDSCREGFSKLHLNCPMFHTEFEYLNKPLTPMFSLDKLIINYAGWVTTRHLTKLFINCKQVLLDRCSLENINVKQLIQTWIYGYSQWNRTWLTFDSIDFSLADIMRGKPSTVVPTEEIGWAFRFLGELTIGAYRIQQQKTGVEAYVISYRETLNRKQWTIGYRDAERRELQRISEAFLYSGSVFRIRLSAILNITLLVKVFCTASMDFTVFISVGLETTVPYFKNGLAKRSSIRIISLVEHTISKMVNELKALKAPITGFLQCTKWIRERLENLTTMEFADSLESLKDAFDQQKLNNREIQKFKENVDRCFTRQSEVSAADYQQLSDFSERRTADLDTLMAYVRAAQTELDWISQREMVEVSRDWSDMDQLDLPMLTKSYAQLLHDMAVHENQRDDVRIQGSVLLNKGHPDVRAIEMYMKSMQTRWDWLLALCKCFDYHVRDAQNLKMLMEKAAEAERWIEDRSSQLMKYDN